MNSSDFLNLIEFETDEISHLFRKASAEGKGTPQEIADRRESVVKKFLEKYFPFPYRVAKGNIIDSYGLRSNSIDCIVLNPCHPFTVSNENNFSIIFSDGVDIAVEVKPNLGNQKELFRSLEQVRSVKQLRRKKSGIHRKIGTKLDSERDLTSKQIPTIIFCEKAYSKIDTLINKVGKYYIEKQIQKREQFDMIVINGEGILFNSRKNMNIFFGDSWEGLFFVKYEKKTLAMMLFYLNKFPQCDLKLGPSVINFYMTDDTKGSRTNEAINEALKRLN